MSKLDAAHLSAGRFVHDARREAGGTAALAGVIEEMTGRRYSDSAVSMWARAENPVPIGVAFLLADRYGLSLDSYAKGRGPDGVADELRAMRRELAHIHVMLEQMMADRGLLRPTPARPAEGRT